MDLRPECGSRCGPGIRAGETWVAFIGAISVCGKLIGHGDILGPSAHVT